MLFNSHEFILVFLPISFFVYFYLNHKKLTIASKIWLVFASLFFYSWWNILYLPLILASMVFNFLVGASLGGSKAKRISMLVFGIFSNVLLFAYFKYSDFLIGNFNLATNSNIELLNLTLPLAISFFTFQQIAYLVDSYRGEAKEYSFLNYAVFVTFFPQLIAGPIVHHKEMMPQFMNIRNKVIKYKNVALGIFIFSIGLFKKVVIADTFAVFANAGFNTEIALHFFEAWATSLSYTAQLYFDFSGYTDMAIGLALLFNINLPINFNSPYKATNIQDFWKRWHITLSRFLRDYVYIPLGGNREGRFKTYNNLMATFIIGGIWHGASWTFVFWGFLHGLALIVFTYWKTTKIKIHKFIAWFITFNFINIAFVFFRANSFEGALAILKSMLYPPSIRLPEFMQNYTSLDMFSFGGWMHNISSDGGKEVVFLIFLSLIIFSLKNTKQLSENFKCNIKYLLFLIVIILINLFYISNEEIFLYYEF